MATMIARFRVRDFGRWRAFFDRMAPARKEYGIVGASVHRDASDPNVVVTILAAAPVGDLRRWAASEALRAAMTEAGVGGPPELRFLEDVE